MIQEFKTDLPINLNLDFPRKSSNGVLVLDANESEKISLKIPLAVSRYTSQSLDSVLDTTFSEFVPTSIALIEDPVTATSIEELEGKNAILEFELKVKELESQVLKDLNRFSIRSTSPIKDFLLVGEELNNSNPKIMSRGKTCIAFLQPDGNFVIYKGVFDDNGNGILLANNVLFARYSLPGSKLSFDEAVGLSLIEIAPNNLRWTTQVQGGYLANLDDSGVLSIFNRDYQLIWTSFNQPVTEPIQIV